MRDITIKKAKGSYIWDNDNKRYIDFTSSIFTANVGHSNKQVLRAIRRQTRIPLLHIYGYRTDIKEQYKEALRLYSGKEPFICSTGSEAIEWAIHLIKLYNKKHKIKGTIYGLNGFFHGKTLGARALYSDTSVNDIKPLRVLPDDIAGLVIEAYEGWSGKFHDIPYIRQLFSITKKRGALVVFDEVQSGFGRCGMKWGHYYYGVEPDIIVCGKGMGGGITLAGVLADKSILYLSKELSTTYGGNPISCACGLAVLKETERLDLIREAHRKGVGLHKFLNNVCSRLNIKVNGVGMMSGLVFKTKQQADKLYEYCMDNGLMVVNTGKPSIKIAPPLVISDGLLIEGLKIIKDGLCSLKSSGILG